MWNVSVSLKILYFPIFPRDARVADTPPTSPSLISLSKEVTADAPIPARLLQFYASRPHFDPLLRTNVCLSPTERRRHVCRSRALAAMSAVSIPAAIKLLFRDVRHCVCTPLHYNYWFYQPFALTFVRVLHSTGGVLPCLSPRFCYHRLYLF